MPIEPPDYLQFGYPVLSFLYALYSDNSFATREHGRWAKDNNYRGFLDNYKQDANHAFPANVETLVGATIPNSNDPNSAGLYFPTPNQANVGIDAIFAEIKASPSGPRPTTDPRSTAQFNDERPALGILAVVFLNQGLNDVGNIAAEIAGLPYNQPIKDLLTRFSQSRPAQMSAVEETALRGVLLDEFIAPPPRW